MTPIRKYEYRPYVFSVRRVLTLLEGGQPERGSVSR